MKTIFYMTLMGLLFMLNTAETQESPSILHNYIKRALEANTHIRASALAVEAARQDSRLRSSLPDPALMIEGRGIPLDGHFGDTRELMFMLEQMFPPPGSLERMRQRGNFAADIENEMQRAVELDIIRQVKQAFYEATYLDAALAANGEHATLLQHFEDIAESKYITGKATQQDLYQIKIEKARLESERASLRDKYAGKTAEFNRLLNRQLGENVRTDSVLDMPPAIDSTNAQQLLEKYNPFLAAARIRINSRENDIELARANSRPAFNVMGGYMAMNNMDDALMGRVGVTLPFMPWSSKDTRAALEKSRVLKNKADVDYQTLKDQFGKFTNIRTRFH